MSNRQTAPRHEYAISDPPQHVVEEPRCLRGYDIHAAIGNDPTFSCSLRLAETEHHLISLATNKRVENSSLMIVVWITKRGTAGRKGCRFGTKTRAFVTDLG